MNKMFRFLVVLCCFVSINGQLSREAHPAPEPYSFAFSSPNEDGTSSSREETGDANGRITGSYTILGADGQQRLVKYVADENGFRAHVMTNEIGTESQNSADAQYISSAPTAAESVAQWEASGAGKTRAQAGPAISRPSLALAPIRPAIRRPVTPVRSGGLIPSPVAPNGGGIAGAQGLRIAPVIRGSTPAAPIGVAAPVPASVGPLPPPKDTSFGSFRSGFGPQPQRPQLGLFGGPIGVAPIGLGFNQFSAGVTPLGAGGFQQLQAFRPFGGPVGGQGFAFGNYPVDNGANVFLVPTNALQTPYPSGLTQQKLTTTDSNLSEGYARKSK